MSVMFIPYKPTCSPTSAFTTTLLKDLYVVLAFKLPSAQSEVKFRAVIGRNNTFSVHVKISAANHFQLTA